MQLDVAVIFKPWMDISICLL